MQRDIDKGTLTPEQTHRLFVFSTVVALFGIGINLRTDLVEEFAAMFYSSYATADMETVDSFFKKQESAEAEAVSRWCKMDCAGEC